MKNFKEIINFARERGPKTISVACCQDKEVLMAVEMARKEKIANSILIGDIEKTKAIAKDIDLDLNNYELLHIEDLSEASLKSVELVTQGKADMVMPLSMSAVAAGADGLMIEVHNDPAHALCDGKQSITPDTFKTVAKKVLNLKAFLNSEEE